MVSFVSSTYEPTNNLWQIAGQPEDHPDPQLLENSEIYNQHFSQRFHNLTGRFAVLDRSIHEAERDDENMAASTHSHNPLEESTIDPPPLTNSVLDERFGDLERKNEVVKNNNASQIKTNKRKIVLYVALLVVAVASAALTSFMTVGFALTGNLPFAALTGAAALGSLATIGICIAKIAQLSRENKRLQGLV